MCTLTKVKLVSITCMQEDWYIASSLVCVGAHDPESLGLFTAFLLLTQILYIIAILLTNL